MKILSGDLEPSSGNVFIDKNTRLAKLNQDQFAYENFSLIDTVLMGHKQLWKIKTERERIYSLPEMSEEDGLKVADLEIQFAELDGYSAEAKAGELLLQLDIAEELHFDLMSKIPPGLKVRVLLAQVLFADPDVMLLDEPTNNLDINTIRWLEDILIQKNCTMIIISHDRHFLNKVCTHIADLDYQDLKIFPGNYDDFMIAAEQIKQRMISDNEKKKAQLADLQTFVSRFSANASKAKQATSRLKLMDKIKLEEMRPSSRQNPFIRFEVDKKLFRNILHINKLVQGYENNILLDDVKLRVEVGEKIAIIGKNGIGKTTFMETIFGNKAPISGVVKWSENANIGYYAQDHKHEFEEDLNLLDWMDQWKPKDKDEQFVRSILGRMLFTQNDIKKSVKVLSGGEQGRMLIGKLIMQKANILLLDEPTNHMDMESIESLNLALEHFEGTLLFISHDRQFVSSIASRIIEITDKGIIDFSGNYEEYLQKEISN